MNELEKIKELVILNKNTLNYSREEAKQKVLELKSRIKADIQESVIDGILDEVYGNEYSWFEKGVFIPKILGDCIMDKYIFKSIPSRNSTIYVYDGGVYKDSGEAVIKEEARKMLGKKAKNLYINEVIGHIEQSTYIFQNQINQDPYIINLKNGFYYLLEKKLKPHNPEIFSITQLPVYYDPEADCPLIKKFVSEIVYKEFVPVIQELFGYLLWKDYFIQKAFMFVGEGSNGKSTLIKLIKAFLGEENISSVALQNLDKNRFATSSLYGKMANLYSDISDEALFKTGVFKILTGGDTIQAEKKYKDDFKFVNFAKLIFACNKIPETRDNTEAFFRRWIIITFPNKFEGASDDKGLIAKLTSEKELSGLFNWALEGLERLLKNNSFSNVSPTEETSKIYMKMSSSVAGFVIDCCVVDLDNEMSKDDLYSAYCQYCRENKFFIYNKEVFFRKLAIYAEHLKVIRVKEGLRRVWKIKGLRLKEEYGQNEKEEGLGDFL